MNEDFIKDMYKDIMGIEDKIEEEPEQELFMCSNCNEFVPEDYGKHTEHDGFICEQCLNDGYGQ